MLLFPKSTCTLVMIVLLTAAPTSAQDVWSATLTVGELPGQPTVGYFNFEQGKAGNLSDTEFVVDGEQHTVWAMYLHRGSDDGRVRRSVVVALSPPFTRDNWAFKVDDESFLVSMAYRHEVINGFDYIVWAAPDHEWTVGQRITVWLTRPQSVPVLPLPALAFLIALLSAAGIARRWRTR